MKMTNVTLILLSSLLVLATVACSKGGSKSKSGTTATVDTTAPTVTNVTSALTNGTYVAGQTLTIQVVFSEAVDVTGTPTLTLETGTTDRNATYTSGTGTDTLVFSYTIQSGDSTSDLDYKATTSLALAGGTIADSSDNDADLTLASPGAIGSLGANRNFVVDAVVRTVTNVTSSTTNGTYSAGNSISIQITFSGTVVVTGTPTLTLETGTTDRTASYSTGSNSSTLTFTYTVNAADHSNDLDYTSTSALSGVIRDVGGVMASLTLPTPGATGSLGANKALVLSNIATVTGVAGASGNGTYNTNETILIDVNFSQNVNVTSGTPTLTLETGTTDRTAYYNSGSGTSSLRFAYTVQNGDTSSDLDYVGASSLVGNIADDYAVSATLTLPTPAAAGSLGANSAYVVSGTGITPMVRNGTNFSCYLNTAGAVRCWGQNNFGMLGQGSIVTLGDGSGEISGLPAIDLGTGRTATSIGVGTSHACAVLDNGTLKCWGRNTSGQLGQDSTANLGDGSNEMGNNLNAINLGVGRTARQVVAGSAHTCALLDNNTVKCWGLNTNGQLGVGSSTTYGNGGAGTMATLAAVNLGAGRTATQIAAGYSHTCALLDNATVKCWGYGAQGQLGYQNTSNLGTTALEMTNLAAINFGTRTPAQIMAGGNSTCAVYTTGAMSCWGEGAYGKLGNGNTNNIGDGANEMGNNLASVTLGTGRTARLAEVGPTAVCALLDNSRIKCWGANSSGQLGQNNTNDIGDGAGEMAALNAIDLGTSVLSVSIGMGDNHACSVVSSGTLKCWGDNTYGQLGLENTTSHGNTSNSMGDNLLQVAVP